MADFSMFGPEASPVRLAERDAVDQYSKIAQANYTSILAAKQADELTRTKRIAAAFSGTDPNNQEKPLTGAQSIMRDAETLRKLGEPEKSSKLMSEAALTMSREAATKASEQQGALNQAKVVAAQMDNAAVFLDNVTDDQSFADMNAQIEQATGQPSPYRGMTYSPRLIESLKKAGLTAKQRALLPYEQQRLESQVESADSLQAYRKARLAIFQADQAVRAERAARTTKEGGAKVPVVGDPSKSEVTNAAREVLGRYPDLPDLDAARFAYTIAADAKAIAASNRGISREVAMQRAFEMHADEIKTVDVTEKVLGSESIGRALGKTKPVSQLVRKPTTPAAGDVEIPQRAVKGMTFQEGRRYQLPDGRIGIRRGNGFEIVEK